MHATGTNTTPANKRQPTSAGLLTVRCCEADWARRDWDESDSPHAREVAVDAACDWRRLAAGDSVGEPARDKRRIKSASSISEISLSREQATNQKEQIKSQIKSQISKSQITMKFFLKNYTNQIT